MKKLFFAIIQFIIFCFAFSFRASASYLPPTLPDTSVVPSFLESVAQSYIVNDTNTYMPTSDLNSLNQIVNGRSIADSFQYAYLDNSSLSSVIGDLYTVNGVEVNADDTYTVYGTSDIGDFMCICKKDTGEILYQGTGQNAYSTLCGGNGLRESFPQFIVRDLSLSAISNINGLIDACNDAKLDSMIIYGNSLTESDKEFLSDYRFYFKMTTSQGWSVYVPNACTSEVLVRDTNNHYSYHGTVPVGNDPNLSPVVFTTDPSQVYFSGTGNFVGLRRENNTYWSSPFSYVSNYYNIYGILYNGGTVDMELPTQSQFNTYKNKASDSVYLQPVDNVSNPNDSDIYNYTEYISHRPVYNRYLNNNYNYQGDTNYNNYPTYYNAEYPTYTTQNDYVTNIYNYYTTPNSSGGEIGSINDPILPENIPLLSNLEYRFPFCIPFDLYKIAQGLSVPRETPYIDTTIIIPNVNYEWHIQYDLHRFDDVASLFRLIELILFIAGLAIFSYQHFFGS